jgi:hypothetical protein
MSSGPNGSAGGGAAPRPDHGGYETSDARAGATIRAGLYILAVMFAVAAALVPLYRWLARSETAEQPQAATLLHEKPEPGTFPRLVANEPQTLAEVRGQEDVVLNGYAWVEKDRGIARMPIAEAIRIVGERGKLPVFPAPSPSGRAPAASRAPEVPTIAGGGR